MVTGNIKSHPCIGILVVFYGRGDAWGADLPGRALAS
jgi:hypothetical protein